MNELKITNESERSKYFKKKLKKNIKKLTAVKGISYNIVYICIFISTISTYKILLTYSRYGRENDLRTENIENIKQHKKGI